MLGLVGFLRRGAAFPHTITVHNSQASLACIQSRIEKLSICTECVHSFCLCQHFPSNTEWGHWQTIYVLLGHKRSGGAQRDCRHYFVICRFDLVSYEELWAATDFGICMESGYPGLPYENWDRILFLRWMLEIGLLFWQNGHQCFLDGTYWNFRRHKDISTFTYRS